MSKLATMLADLIFDSYPEMTEQEYLDVVGSWKALKDTDKAEAFYRAEVLPRSCYRVRSRAADSKVKLLFVPVGTQPYAPTMSCLGLPAEVTVFLYTSKSKPFAIEVSQAFSSGPHVRVSHLVKIDETDATDIVRKVQSAYDGLGQAAGQGVICDITGGTKVMTATLAGIAAVNGWRQSYVESIYLADRKGSYNERVVQVASVFEHMGGWHKGMAWRLAGVGQFKEAAQSLRLAMKESVASGSEHRHLKRFALAQAYREGRVEKVASEFLKLAKSLSVHVPPRTLAVIESGPLQGLLYQMASCLAAEGQDLAACAILARLGRPCEIGQVRQQLKAIAIECSLTWRIPAWKPVEDLLGRKYSKEVAAFG